MRLARPALAFPALARPALACPALACLVFAAIPAGCTEFPELDAAVPREVTQGTFPRLLPMEQILAGTEAREDGESLEAFEARVAALRARAERLRRRDPDAE